MKKQFAALTATALISVAPYAVSALSTELTVTGPPIHEKDFRE
ncbi:hypothetical protein [Pseudomonas sp. PGPR40]|nr:hypothetical protein [Pseudomonas sp. PGPR40]